MDMNEFIAAMPKAELHMHIEGTVSAAKVLELADRNGVDIPYATEAEVLAAQDYGTPALKNFLDYHYMCSSVLRRGRDVFDITQDFLNKCLAENIRHVELFFDPQQHIDRGVTKVGYVLCGWLSCSNPQICQAGADVRHRPVKRQIGVCCMNVLG